MWWTEVLTPAVIMGSLICAVGFVNVGFQKLQNGGKLRRKCDHTFDWHLLLRDHRIAGHYFDTKGLESLPGKKTE